MYHVVAEAIKKEGLSDEYHPQDYLNFFCLGKREASSSHQTCSSSSHTNLQPTENRALVRTHFFSYIYIIVELKIYIIERLSFNINYIDETAGIGSKVASIYDLCALERDDSG